MKHSTITLKPKGIYGQARLAEIGTNKFHVIAETRIRGRDALVCRPAPPDSKHLRVVMKDNDLDYEWEM